MDSDRRPDPVNDTGSTTDLIFRGHSSQAGTFRDGAVRRPPKRRLAVVACMDARIDVFALLGLQPGDANVLRNAGGVVTDDVIRSLMVSQRLLGTQEIMLIHHTDCGMLAFDGEEMKREVEAETGVRPPFSMETFADLETNVRDSMALVRNCPFLPSRTLVRGFIYDVTDGSLHEVAAVPQLSGSRALG